MIASCNKLTFSNHRSSRQLLSRAQKSFFSSAQGVQGLARRVTSSHLNSENPLKLTTWKLFHFIFSTRFHFSCFYFSSYISFILHFSYFHNSPISSTFWHYKFLLGFQWIFNFPVFFLKSHKIHKILLLVRPWRIKYFSIKYHRFVVFPY